MVQSGVRSVVSRRGPESPPFHSGPPPTPVPGPVTAIREVARRAGRYAVEVAGVAIAPVSVDTIAELKLRVGRVLDAVELARLVEATAMTACYDKALDALARRARSAKDLERWLADREHPRAAISAALDRLTALGLLDDLAFARAFARSRASGKGFGPRRVVAELGRKGVPRPVIDQVMRELETAADEESDGASSAAEREVATVRVAAEKRLRSLAKLEPEVARRRLTGWLVRRGFGVGVPSRVARELLPR